MISSLIVAQFDFWAQYAFDLTAEGQFTYETDKKFLIYQAQEINEQKSLHSKFLNLDNIFFGKSPDFFLLNSLNECILF